MSQETDIQYKHYAVKLSGLVVPEPVSYVTSTLENAGFEAFLVGGCVRDLLIGRKPKDWDVTTNALPQEIINLFSHTFYENNYGTVGVVDDNVSDETQKVIEVTPYRLEGLYSDHRRPDDVRFAESLIDDLKRRDFTINALAYSVSTEELVDPHGGFVDLGKRILRTVGDPSSRFTEDGLRILRAVRFATELELTIEHATTSAIRENANILNSISKERIRDELVKIIASKCPSLGFELLRALELIKYTIPDLERGIGVAQNRAHSFDVWTHLLKTLQHSADKDFPIHLRIAALLHDISKPETRKWSDETGTWTFYGHEVVGARVAKKILRDLKFSHETIDIVTNLVRWHMFFSDTDVVTHSAVRRMIANVGKERIRDLVHLRHCDRIGTGRPKEDPYRLRKYEAMIDEVMHDPISTSMLEINGHIIQERLGVKPGPIIGRVMTILLDEILERPELNTSDHLEKRALEILGLSEREQRELDLKAKGKIVLENERSLKAIRKRHFVD